MSTFCVSDPKSTAAMPLRPWLAMKMMSQPFFSACSMIASEGEKLFTAGSDELRVRLEKPETK